MSLRWGIFSAGRISNDFVAALETLPANDHQVVAVAARKLSDANTFAATFNIPKAYEGYDGLANDKTINVVYIGTINTKHLEAAKAMLDAGKHVLCEKPLTMNERQSRELIEYAQSKKLFLMEAVWSRCFPAYHELRQILDAGEIGDILHAQVSFGFPLEHVDRVSVKELGGGTILDLGIYTLQFLQFVFKGLHPKKMIASGHLNIHQVDESGNAVFLYEGNKTGVLSTSARVEMPNVGIIIGTKGTIQVPKFWSPSTLITPSGTKTFDLPSSTRKFNFGNSQGLAYEAEEVRRCINLGLLESPRITHSDSLELSSQMDFIRSQIGVVYEQDK